jgi:hypothetical protein
VPIDALTVSGEKAKRPPTPTVTIIVGAGLLTNKVEVFAKVLKLEALGQ